MEIVNDESFPVDTKRRFNVQTTFIVTYQNVLSTLKQRLIKRRRVSLLDFIMVMVMVGAFFSK